ncbi:hypothetical protein CJU90_2565 [Yarrowia sp. C11]|nr:hypothetical protein CKK34_4013 [Yarrowia sp. E02]KAG5369121.1 hypothetical protein CJU90_2565 [Yarrowia sp. C11]
MGAGGSKEEQPKSRVFVPQTPVEFSSSLINSLESSLESDYTRSQSAGQLVQQKVSEELAKVQYQAQEALALAKKNLEQAEKNEVAETDSVSSADLAAKFEALKNKFETSTYVTELDKETDSVRETLVKCLQDNKGRPLDCYEEVEQFKAKLRTLA